MKGTKHTVTDKTGKVHTRTSQSRVYAFAVVRHWDAHSYPCAGSIVERPAGSAASWCGRIDLAQKEKASMLARGGFSDVEIVPAVIVGGPAR